MDNKNILVTGGAGYIGSHACKALKKKGYTPITIDNLVTGWKDAVKFGPFELVDILNEKELDRVYKQYKPFATMHFAALSEVGESIKKPGLYWRNNVQGSLNLIETSLKNNCSNFIYSSTCATYGEQDNVHLNEKTIQLPSNAYGLSKKAVEDILSNFAKITNLSFIIFRYFNVAGADCEYEIGEFHKPETHLIPSLLDVACGKRDKIKIYGTNYDTPDGTCIRDYIHVSDLIEAHIIALETLGKKNIKKIYNLGTNTGFSVREVINCVKKITNSNLKVEEAERRIGDCNKLVANSKLAKVDLGWKPQRSELNQIILDAWKWHQIGNYNK